MEDLSVDYLGRTDARRMVMELPRGQEYRVHALSDGRHVTIRTDGTKKGQEGDDIKRTVKHVLDKDFTIHYTNERRRLNYTDDFLVDFLTKSAIIKREKGEDHASSWLAETVMAPKESVELNPVQEIMRRHRSIGVVSADLPGHSIEFLLAVIRWLGVQEDVNYWGTKYKDGKKKGKFEGREKPLNAISDLFIKKLPLATIIRKHMLY